MLEQCGLVALVAEPAAFAAVAVVALVAAGKPAAFAVAQETAFEHSGASCLVPEDCSEHYVEVLAACLLTFAVQDVR